MTIVQALVNGLLVGSVWAILGLGKQLVLGVIHFVNFAHGHLVLVGMYLSYIVWQYSGLDLTLVIPVVAISMFAVGLLLNAALVRHLVGRDEQSQVVATLALALIIENTALIVFSPQPRSVNSWWADSSFQVAGIYVNWGQFLGLAVSAATFAGVWFFVTRTPMGILIRATSQNSKSAQYQGVRTKEVYAVAFGLSVALAGLVGAILVISMPVEPTTAWSFLVIMFVVPVLGGMGSIPGTAIAGLLVGIIQVFTSTFVSIQLQNAAVYVLFLVFLVLRPQGLLGKSTHQEKVSV